MENEKIEESIETINLEEMFGRKTTIKEIKETINEFGQNSYLDTCQKCALLCKYFAWVPEIAILNIDTFKEIFEYAPLIPFDEMIKTIQDGISENVVTIEHVLNRKNAMAIGKSIEDYGTYSKLNNPKYLDEENLIDSDFESEDEDEDENEME